MGMLLRRYHKGDGGMPSPVDAIVEENETVDVDAIVEENETVDVDVEKKKPGRKPKATTEEKE